MNCGVVEGDLIGGVSCRPPNQPKQRTTAETTVMISVRNDFCPADTRIRFGQKIWNYKTISWRVSRESKWRMTVVFNDMVPSDQRAFNKGASI